METLGVTDVLQAVSAARLRRTVRAFSPGKRICGDYTRVSMTLFVQQIDLTCAEEIFVGVTLSNNTHSPCLDPCS